MVVTKMMTTKLKKNQEKANNSPSYHCAAIKNKSRKQATELQGKKHS